METTQSADQEVKVNKPAEPNHDEIAARAFAIYLEEGQPEGRAWDHWLMAEKLVQEERRSVNWTPAQVEGSQLPEFIQGAMQNAPEPESPVPGSGETSRTAEQRRSRRAAQGRPMEHVGAV